jgi:uncharacterized membrane protein (UPF0127 family)
LLIPYLRCLTLLVLLLCALRAPLTSADPLLTYPLTINGHALRVEVANTDVQRRRGLMFRHALGEDHGMIFIYPRKDVYSMWMKNTAIALSVAFIDESGKILNIADMVPYSEQSHAAAGEATYALETRQGWFKRKGVRAGHRVHGLHQLPKAE